ncbi:hypothetical protein MRGR3_2438 [Staphylococcus aureus subsp. aureus MRGR3]|nr:hypothetical protein MRGR3_2438 [Staphylococcus aureus subsp. aureus MRGR3]
MNPKFYGGAIKVVIVVIGIFVYEKGLVE